MKKANIFILFTAFQILFTEMLNAVLVANKMQHFQNTKNPYVKVGFINFVKVMNMTLNAIPTRNITTSNVDKCKIECFMARPVCFGFNFVHTMNNTSDSTNCKLYEKEVALYDLVPNKYVHHYALENPCLTLPCHNGGTCIRNITLDTYTCKCAFFYSGTNCDIYGEEKLVRNNLIKVLPILRRTWSLSFDIKPMGLSNMQTNVGHANVVHATINKDNIELGDRTPSIWFMPDSSELNIESAVKGKNTDRRHIFISAPLLLNEYTNVNVSQLLIGNDYVYSILINGSNVSEVVNTVAQEFKHVKLYASDPWYQEANAYIKNLIYENIV